MADGAQQPARRYLRRLPRFAQFKQTISERLLLRLALWQSLRRDARHPVARHLARQLKRGWRLPILPFSLACALPLLVLAAYAYNAIAEAMGWALPLFLMLFSTVYCAVWIVRIVALMSRQARSGAMDEVSVIPPGRVFIYLTICKVVLNEDDALYWLGLLRRVLAGGAFLILIMSLCIVTAQMNQLSLREGAAVSIELMLFAVVIQLEYSQSALIACLLAVAVGSRLNSVVDRASVIVAGFILLQILSYSLVLAAVVALGLSSLSLTLALFLLSRELLIILLWRAILHDANEDYLPPRTLHWMGELRQGNRIKRF